MTLMAALMCVLGVMSQNLNITGTVIDSEMKEKLPRATVQLLTTDSTFVTGAISDDNGVFALSAARAPRYIVRVSVLGFKTLCRDVTVGTGQGVDMGTVAMQTDAVMLSEATATANVPKVVVKDDTLEYNAAAYRVAEGSTVEALVEKLPGAQIDDNGNITINGKQVKKIMLDGREFMGGDPQTALKNLPAEVIEKIRSYDEKSDMSKLTGIDDGNEQAVLDFGVKKSKRNGFNANANGSYGTHDRYASRLFGARFSGNLRYSVTGNANNTNDMGFSGRRGRSGGRSGLRSSKSSAANISYDEKNRLHIDANVRWGHSDGDSWSRTSSESFVNKRGAFGNSTSQSYSRGNNWNAGMKLEWKPDTMTTITLRPNLGLSSSDNMSGSKSATFRNDPYLYSDDPLSDAAVDAMAADSLVVNARHGKSMSYSNRKEAGTSAQWFRKLNSRGRNIAIGANVNWSRQHSMGMSASNVHLYLVKDRLGNDSTYQTNRYNLTPSDNLRYGINATYTEPLWKGAFLQLNYSLDYNHSKSDRSTYDFEDMGESLFGDILNRYRDWDSYLSTLQYPLDHYYDERQSRYSEYRNLTHNVNVQLRIVTDHSNLNAGVMVRPQRSHFAQDFHGVSVDTVRNVLNVAPTFNFRYRFNKRTDLRVNYRGTTDQPSITQMLDITDDSNPLFIRKGNPGLRPSFTNNMGVNFKTTMMRYQQTIAANVSMRSTRNSISDMVTYDDNTGGRTTQPQNINGNWNMSAMFMFNTSLDTAAVWNINTYTQLNHDNYVSYLTLNRKTGVQKNVTRTTTYIERLSASYRSSWLDVELDGSLNYRHTRNMLQPKSNMDTWHFNYGVNVELTAPADITISTDLHEHCRRGYSDQSLNTNELIWNLQLSKRLLRNRQMSLMLQFYDILGQQSNFSRSITASRRSDTEYNSINSYVMLSMQYRLNVFGGKVVGGGKARQRQRQRRGGGA